MSDSEIVEQKNMIIRELVFVLDSIGVEFEHFNLMTTCRLLSEQEYQQVHDEIDHYQKLTDENIEAED